tara:strand:+ start:114 stop:335 length:222 start_codon:yes stop_codon:yes gene_type:complete
MAIINCPECNNKVSDKAESCPNCAFPINQKPTINKVTESKEGCFLQTLNTGCIIIFMIIAFIVIIGIIGAMAS